MKGWLEMTPEAREQARAKAREARSERNAHRRAKYEQRQARHMGENYMHLPILGGGHVTLIWRRLEQTGTIQTVRYSLAFCAPNDQFSRKKGREEAKALFSGERERGSYLLIGPEKRLRKNGDVVRRILDEVRRAGFGILGAPASVDWVPTWFKDGRIAMRTLSDMKATRLVRAHARRG